MGTSGSIEAPSWADSRSDRSSCHAIAISVLRVACSVSLSRRSALSTRPAPLATPSLVIDAATGDVLYEEQATQPWYPASLTKLMTVYVALYAVRDHQISLDTPLVDLARARLDAAVEDGLSRPAPK